jgi:hypothetical protein
MIPPSACVPTPIRSHLRFNDRRRWGDAPCAIVSTIAILVPHLARPRYRAYQPWESVRNMSAPVLTTTLIPDSPEALARGVHIRALAQDLRDRVGGDARARDRHTAR